MKLHTWLSRPLMLLLAAACLSCSRSKPEPPPPISLDEHADALQTILEGYAAIAHATYRECWQGTALLQSRIQGFVRNPTGQGLALLRESWIQARQPYSQSRVFHFQGSPAESSPFGDSSDTMGGWPIRPELIDTVRDQPNAGLVHDTAGHPELTDNLLVHLQQNRSDENAYYLGFHVLEFLLWGEDLYPDAAGLRLHSDFTKAKNADRRRTLLVLLANRLVRDSKRLSDAWDPDQGGHYRERFLNQPPAESLARVLAGMSRVLESGFDEGIQRPLRSASQADESSAFSDTTHLDLLHQALGVRNVWAGRFDGTAGNAALSDPSLQSFLMDVVPDQATQIDRQLQDLISGLQAMEAPFDQLVREEDIEGRRVLQDLDQKARSLGAAIAALAKRLGLGVAPTV